MSSLVLIAITHRSAPLRVLERVALDGGSSDAVAAVIRAMRGVEEAAVVATCNRTELYVVSDNTFSRPLLEALSVLTGAPLADVAGAATVAVDDEASLHLFQVAAGLESRIVGDRQVLGQVRAAAARAAASGTAGPRLAALFQWAAASARRVHRQHLDTVPPSLARIVLDGVASPGALRAPVLVLGAGDMASAVTTELANRHMPYRVAARRPEAAARLTRHPQDVVPFDRVRDELVHADLVVCATSAPEPVVTVADVIHAMARRHGRQLTILDIAMPRNVQPGAAGVTGVTLCDLDSLAAGHPDPHARRSAHAVSEEHARYQEWLAGRASAALIAALHERVHAVCLLEAHRVIGDRPEADRLAHLIAGKLLHGPTLRTKELTARGDEVGIRALAEAFGVDRPAAGLPPAPRPHVRA